jgi:hypothetical protein
MKVSSKKVYKFSTNKMLLDSIDALEKNVLLATMVSRHAPIPENMNHCMHRHCFGLCLGCVGCEVLGDDMS